MDSLGGRRTVAYRFDTRPYGSHRQIVDLVKPDSVVLDVGCAEGFLAAQLLEKGCSVYGIERDTEAAAVARRHCEEVWVGDIETISQEIFSGRMFDCIIYGDVLEHTRDPLAVLRRFDSHLQEDGEVIICIPNIAHFSVRLPLLLGKFSYRDTGILDRTHLRFFTYETGKELIEAAGYAVKEVRYTGAAARFPVLKLLPNLFSYQFIFLCCRNESPTR